MGDTIYGNKFGGDNIHGDKIVTHGSPRPRRPVEPAVVLVMSAGTDQQAPLRVDEERREISHAVRLAGAGERIDVRTADALRLDDLSDVLPHHRPVIAHFSGHGVAGAGIVVTDDLRQPQSVPPEALSELFRLERGRLQCVVLNACFTEDQAWAIAEHVPFVIGMRGRVLDDTAIRFAAGFYRGIAYARSVRDAFDLGCNRLRLHGHLDADVPRLVDRQGTPDLPVVDRPADPDAR
ncbi:CHAT domain-containing protein [Dactylosporangium sp. NPDC049525]|uniref:CHAT domain-containing protein n=1 Tax=Dactylosporangium sp. NPDC049525 TaxID=3154730 RepID=UPI003445BC55